MFIIFTTFTNDASQITVSLPFGNTPNVDYFVYVIGYSYRNELPMISKVLVTLQDKRTNDLEFWIDSRNFASSSCDKGCGLFMVQNNKFHLRAIFTQRTVSHLIFHDVFKYIARIKEVINAANNPALTMPAISYYNSTQTLKRFHRLVTHECLFPGEDLVSFQKCFALSFRKDGNLVLIHLRSSIIFWQLKTKGKFGSKLCLNENGRLSLTNNKNQTIIKWESGLPTTAWFEIGDDSSLYVRNHRDIFLCFATRYYC